MVSGSKLYTENRSNVKTNCENNYTKHSEKKYLKKLYPY